jgi:GNAT superfamily N-acetyltransferase
VKAVDALTTGAQWRLRRIDRAAADADANASLTEGLAALLEDCVAGGASVGFMEPLTRARTLAFWCRVMDDARHGRRALIVAEDDQGICGTVQLVLDVPENQPHRADVCKMLVHRRARRRGLGGQLLREIEIAARDHGRDLLVLDTVTGSDASRLYERMGWVRVGDIPGYALWPRGGRCSTTVYYRELARPASVLSR